MTKLILINGSLNGLQENEFGAASQDLVRWIDNDMQADLDQLAKFIGGPENKSDPRSEILEV